MNAVLTLRITSDFPIAAVTAALVQSPVVHSKFLALFHDRDVAGKRAFPWSIECQDFLSGDGRMELQFKALCLINQVAVHD